MSERDRTVEDRARPSRPFLRRVLRYLWLLMRVLAVAMAAIGPVPPPPPPPRRPTIEARAESADDEEP